jgi:hypothetical protein
MKKTCNICYGSGQISTFKGESRFHLSVDECPVCCGLGFVLSSDEGDAEDDKKNVIEKKTHSERGRKRK